MGRVLGLVVGALVAVVAGLGLTIYVTRDEDSIQGDNLLAERLARALALAEQSDGVVDLREVAPFAWDRVLLVAPGTPREAISRRLGREWTGIDAVNGGDLLIFLRGVDVVRFADYRGSGQFESFSRPFAELPRERAVLEVRSFVIRPRR